MSNPRFSALARRPLAVAVFSLFGLASLESVAAPAVTNCNDAGTGSLRTAVSGAAEGDFIDLTHLSCSVISLSTGSIHVLKNNLTIAGPGSGKLTISVANNAVNNVISHYGSGTFELDSVKVSGGRLYTKSSGKYFGGGCIASLGNLRLNFDEVSNCAVTAGDNAYGRGGAIFATGDVHVIQSIISGNHVLPAIIPPKCVYIPNPPHEYCYGGGPTSPAALIGGGVFAKGAATFEETLLSGNSADAGGAVYASGGEVFFSTISSNQALAGEAMFMTGKSSLVINASTLTANHGPPHYCYYDCDRPRANALSRTYSVIESIATAGGGQTTRIWNTTFAENPAAVSMIHSQNPLAVYNSTIAFNRAVYYDEFIGPSGISMDNAALTIASSIVSQNGPADIVLTGSATITGDHNLIGKSQSPMPPGTLSGCPMLKILDNNGGLTQTVALRAGSPAIDAGSNPLGLQNDQRGSGFMRGTGNAPDIGAIENIGDRIFDDEFQTGAPPVCS